MLLMNEYCTNISQQKMTTAVPKNKLKSSQSLPEASSGRIHGRQKQVDVEDDNDDGDDGDDSDDANNIHDDVYADDDAADGDDDDDDDDDDDGSGGKIRGRAKRGRRI